MMYRYQYDLNAPGAATQLRVTSTQDLNLNISVSNANMLIQAYSSWNCLNHIDELYRKIVSVDTPTSLMSSLLLFQVLFYYTYPLIVLTYAFCHPFYSGLCSSYI